MRFEFAKKDHGSDVIKQLPSISREVPNSFRGRETEKMKKLQVKTEGICKEGFSISYTVALTQYSDTHRQHVLQISGFEL